jgi:hypothetical protein
MANEESTVIPNVECVPYKKVRMEDRNAEWGFIVRFPGTSEDDWLLKLQVGSLIWGNDITEAYLASTIQGSLAHNKFAADALLDAALVKWG